MNKLIRLFAFVVLVIILVNEWNNNDLVGVVAVGFALLSATVLEKNNEN